MERYRQNRRTPASVIAGEAAVVTPADSRLHVLNPVATRIWELCDRTEGIAFDALLDQVLEEFDVDRGVAQTETRSFLDDAVDAGLIERI